MLEAYTKWGGLSSDFIWLSRLDYPVKYYLMPSTVTGSLSRFYF